MGNLGETARPGNRGDQLAPLCNSRDQFLSRKERPYQQLGRRVYLRCAVIGSAGLPSTLLASSAPGGPPSFHRGPRESGDEAVEEQIVDNGDGYARNQASGHQRAPEVDVAAHRHSSWGGLGRVLRSPVPVPMAVSNSCESPKPQG